MNAYARPVLGLVLGCLLPNAAAAEVDTAEIAAVDQGGNWLAYGRNYSEQRYSPLDSVNQSSVSRLGLQWVLELPGMKSLNSTPLVVEGVLYFSGSWSVVTAVDARTGQMLWQHDPQTLKHAGENAKIMWDFNRGIAYWRGKIYVGTGDGRLVALDAKTGREIWSTLTLDRSTSRTINGPPKAFNGLVVIGHGGGDLGPIRGYVTAYDAETGAQRWRFHIVPGNPADGFEDAAMAMAAQTWNGEWWKHGGGGAVWHAITYDPEFNRVYLGTGNGGPWNQKIRSPGGGDNLFLCAIVALDADTGEYVWHYQTVPGETWDYNSSMDIVLGDLSIDGTQRKVLMHAPKNGFFYVLERATGKLISADKIGKVTWAERVDLETGRPVEVPGARYEDGEVLLWPSGLGAHNWHPMSYSPDTGLVYIPYQEMPGYFSDKGIDLGRWKSRMFTPSLGVKGFEHDIPADLGWSALMAWHPIEKREVWRVKTPGIWNPGTLTTAGRLVFQGRTDGRFIAYAADSGEALWRFETGLGISAPPMTYAVDGVQYVSLLVGWGGAGAALGGSMAAQHGWAYGQQPRRLLTFALDGPMTLPPTPLPVYPEPLDPPLFEVNAERAAAGAALYNDHCAACHGAGAAGGGFAPDLRASSIAADARTLRATVHAGRPERGMPAFKSLQSADLDALQHYLRQSARAAVSTGRPDRGR